MLNWVDLVAAGVVLMFAAAGWRRGFVHELADIAGLMLSLAAAFLLFRYPARWFESNPLANVLSFLVIFFIVSTLAGMLFGRMLRRISPQTRRSSANRIPGVALGAAKGAILAALIIIALATLPIGAGMAVNNTYTGKLVLEHGVDIQTRIASLIPEDAIQGLGFITIRPEADATLDVPVRRKTEVNSAAEQQMLELVNQERTSRGLPALRVDPQIRDVARLHSRDMFNRGYFSHTSPDGLDPFDRMRGGGISYLAAGENIAMAPTVPMAHRGLMNSPGHRANILRPAFRRVGIGVHKSGGQMMFTQNFAN